MTDLSNKMNRLSKLIRLEQKKLTYIASMLGEEMAAYEYYEDLDEFFYSDNLLAMVEMTEAEAKQGLLNRFRIIKQSVGDTQDRYENSEYLETKSGKTIRIRRTYFKKTLYALLEDVTGSRREVAEYQKRIVEECEKNYRDVLTDLYNRKKIQEEVDEMISTGEASGIFLLLDLDNFKRVNDRKGHLEGDNLLRKFAEIMTEYFTDTDILARIGGDEFVVLVPNEVSKEALANQLELFLQKTRVNLGDYYKKMRLSVSIGGVYIRPEFKNFDEVYHAADQAMYAAKKAGKDSFFIQSEKN